MKNNKILRLPSKLWYTIEDLFEENKDFQKITARVRHTNAISDGKVVQIGVVPGGKGAPLKAYTLAPVTKEAVEQAKKDGIVLMESVENLVKVVSVNPSPSPSVFSGPKSAVV